MAVVEIKFDEADVKEMMVEHLYFDLISNKKFSYDAMKISCESSNVKMEFLLNGGQGLEETEALAKVSIVLEPLGIENMVKSMLTEVYGIDIKDKPVKVELMDNGIGVVYVI